jgi:hypothetical protein
MGICPRYWHILQKFGKHFVWFQTGKFHQELPKNKQLHATLTALFGKNKFISNGRKNPFSLQSIIIIMVY